MPQAWLGCQLAIGLLLVCWVATTHHATPASLLPTAAFLLPLLAILQIIPLPLELVKRLSPQRAEIHQSIAAVIPGLPSWTPLSVHPEATLDFAATLAAYACVYAIARGLGARLTRHRFAAAAPIVLVAAAQAAIALLQNLAGEPATGSYVNRNHLAGLLEMALPFALLPAISLLPGLSLLPGRGSRAAVSHGRSAANRRVRTALLQAAPGVAALGILAAILATRSRGGLVAALASLLVMGLLALKRSPLPPKKWLLGAALLAALAAAFVYLPSQNLVQRYAHLFGKQALRREGRVLLWSETLDLIAAYPLTGCGLGAYEPAFLRYKRSAPMVSDPHAHNDYLELAAEAGIPAFTLCLLLVAQPIASALRAALQSRPARNLSLACLGSLTAILAHSLVDFNLRIPANALVCAWVLGLSAATARAPRQTKRRNLANFVAQALRVTDS
jgi:O-antigen ligase